MKLLYRLGTQSLVYAATNVMQKGAAFLLLPLYTRYLTPGDYGIVAVVTGVCGFLAILLTFSLHGALIRFYFEYRDDLQRLREFWGTVLTFVTLSSIGGVLLLLTIGNFLLSPLLGDVAFWPYVAIGLLTVLFQPFVTTFLNILQARGEALRYAAFSLANFGCTLAVTVGLVVFAGWGALGPLIGGLASSMVFCVVALYALRADFRWSLNMSYLREALSYSLPQVPHSLSWQVMSAADKVILNRYLGLSAAGIYNVGAMFGMIVDLIGQSVNRAYVPLSMEALKQGQPEVLAQLRDMGVLMVTVFALLASFVAFFSRELVTMLTAPAFHDAANIVPMIAFAGAANGIYYVLINVLFYDTRATRYLPLGTVVSAAANVGLNLCLVPHFGIPGAAFAALVAQIITTVAIGMIGQRYDPVKWPYTFFAALFATCFAISAAIAAIPIALAPAWVAVKLGLFVVLAASVSHVIWGDFAYLLRWLTVRPASRS